MNDIMIIIRKDLYEMLHNRAFFMMLVVAALIIFMISNSLGGDIDSLAAEAGSDAELYEMAQSHIGTMLLMLVFILMLLVCLYMNAYTVLLEKTQHTLESLLCTPVRLKYVWLGKTLATFIPSLVLGLLLAVGTIIVMNITTLQSEVGRWVIPGAASLVVTLMIIPVVIFLASSLVIILQLMLQNVRLIQTLFTILLFGSSFGLSYIFRFSTNNWNVVYIALGFTAVLGLVVWLLSGKLTKERIVLTSKG